MTNEPVSGGEQPDLYNEPAAYWAETGRPSHADYVAGKIQTGHGTTDPVYGSNPAHFRQEAALAEMLDVLYRRRPAPKSIFEAGCGRGRLAHFFSRVLPTATYSAIDVGESQLEEAQRLRPDGDFQMDDLTSYGFNRRQLARHPETPSYDLVVCAEVLMHIKPEAVRTAFSNLALLTQPSGQILTIDWVPPVVGPARPARTAYWNFAHDYGELMIRHNDINPAEQIRLLESRRTDSQMIFIWERI